MKGHIVLNDNVYAPYLQLHNHIIFLKKSIIDQEFEAINVDELNNPETKCSYAIVTLTVDGDYFVDLSDTKPAVFYYHTRMAYCHTTWTNKLYYIVGHRIRGKQRIKRVMAKVAQLL